METVRNLDKGGGELSFYRYAYDRSGFIIKEEVRQRAEGKTELFTNTYTYTYIEERAGFRFNADSEVYLGLWNGHSENVRMAWKWIDSSGEARYSVTRLDMNGTRSGMIDEIDKEIFEKFKGISVRMF